MSGYLDNSGREDVLSGGSRARHLSSHSSPAREGTCTPGSWRWP
jgi:hypothetical protein